MNAYISMTQLSKNKPRTAISPTREEDYSEWYQQVVRCAELAENSSVRGCMVIRPWGYAIWEYVVKDLDRRIKQTGTRNAYFPLFVPLSHLQKEAQHVDGFAKECAVVTHHRLELNKENELVPASPLEEPLIVRPTSETVIMSSFARWIQSYRDLPLKVNQWANVVRWEMRTRLFLRTAEFLWQEGHTAHATEAEARSFALEMLKVYVQFAEELLALPVIAGEKTESERFPGAEATYTIEAMMQDRKALQAGTSHFLGQHFSKAFDIEFRDQDGCNRLAWTTSWGVTTRLIGALVMVHSDDNGLVLPPRVAPEHVVIVPVLRQGSEERVLEACNKLAESLQKQLFYAEPVRAMVDTRDMGGGEKRWDWIKHGAPVIVEVGVRDIDAGQVTVMERLAAEQRGSAVPLDTFVSTIAERLERLQAECFSRARAFRDKHMQEIDSESAFYEWFTPKCSEKPEPHGGFALVHWGYDAEVEERLKKDLSVTIRCVPHGMHDAPGRCIFTGKPSPCRVIFAKSY